MPKKEKLITNPEFAVFTKTLLSIIFITAIGVFANSGQAAAFATIILVLYFAYDFFYEDDDEDSDN